MLKTNPVYYSNGMTKKGILKVFISSTYRDLKDIRKLIIDRLEKSLTPVAMETFVPVEKTPHEEAIRYLEESDICIFIIGDYYGSIINECKIRNEKCGDCKGKISYTFCEYLRASHLGKPCMVYILKNEIIDTLSGITKFDLGSNCEIDIKAFLERNNISLERMELFRNYSLEELRELWKLALDSDKNKEKLNDFENEVKNILVGEKKISNRQDFLEFYDTVLNELRKNIIRWYKEKKISFNNFIGRREVLKELLNKIQNYKSVCVVGVGGIGKSSLVQLALLIEKLSGKKIYAFYKEYTYKFTQAGYIHSKGRFEESTFHTRLSLTNIITHVFAKDIRLKTILQKDKEGQIKELMNELNNEKAILFIDDLQDAENEVKEFVYSCGNSLIEGQVVAVSSEREGYFSVVGPLKGIKKIEDCKKMVCDFAERYSTYDSIKDRLGDWVKEIHNVTRGHPILIDMIVRNIILISCPEKLKNFTGVLTKIEEQEAINEFMERLVYRILNKNEKSVIILLSVFREPVNMRIFEIIMNKETLSPIIKKGFLKRKGDEITYESELAKEFLETSARNEHHEIAIRYYSQELKYTERFKHPNILIEIIYHLLKIGKFEDAYHLYSERFLLLNRKRINTIEITKILLEKSPNSSKIAPLFGSLGNLYLNGNEFIEAEKSYIKALKIRRELAQKDPGAYRPDVATTLNNLGNLYSDLKRFKEAEKSYTEVLKIYRELAQKDPGAYRPDVAMTLNNLGALYNNLRRFKEAEGSYAEALEYKDALPDEGARIFLGMAELMKNMGRDNSHELYFMAGVVSFNVFVKYSLPSIDFLFCFQNAYELAADKSKIKRMACIAIAILTQNNTKDKLKSKIDEIKSFNLEDLPNICHAVVNLFLKGEAIDLENEEPSNNLELMFYNLYLILKKCNKN
jgi:tetratricopeptide (TPR) repeat protein